jgi:hypothetical protein
MHGLAFCVSFALNFDPFQLGCPIPVSDADTL